jgi:hypothetical protein
MTFHQIVPGQQRRQVWKFDAPAPGCEARLHMPVGTELLHLELQRGAPKIWGLVPIDEPAMEHRWFICAGTGWTLTGDLQHLGSFQDGIGGVWHVFEISAEYAGRALPT